MQYVHQGYLHNITMYKGVCNQSQILNLLALLQGYSWTRVSHQINSQNIIMALRSTITLGKRLCSNTAAAPVSIRKAAEEATSDGKAACTPGLPWSSGFDPSKLINQHFCYGIFFYIYIKSTVWSLLYTAMLGMRMHCCQNSYTGCVLPPGRCMLRARQFNPLALFFFFSRAAF